MILDLFAGPGGWSEAVRSLGHTEVGIEWDTAACRTRAAARHLTIRADVTAYPIEVFAGRLEGLIASPPCPDFSRAGSGLGLEGPTGRLVREVPRWVTELRPAWVACEQVPDVAPIWAEYAEQFRRLGYSVWTGVLNAADFGVPQKRRRAVLMASRVGTSLPPEPTHAANPGMFDAPHVSMGAALEWTDDMLLERRNDQSQSGEVDPRWPLERPATTVAGRPLVADPGSNANRFNGRKKSRNDGYRVTVQEAGVLQGFRSDYPWAGNQGEQIQQIGNAIPPPLAAAILGRLAHLQEQAA